MKYTPIELKKQLKGFIFNADDFLQTVLPKGWNDKRLLAVKNNIIGETNLLTETLANMSALGLKDKDSVKDSIFEFQKKYGTGLTDDDNSTKLPSGQQVLRNRVECDLIYNNATNCEERFVGRRFMWLPSDSENPRHTHMLRYGKVYKVGATGLPKDDEFPGKQIGCKCGYQWVDDDPNAVVEKKVKKNVKKDKKNS